MSDEQLFEKCPRCEGRGPFPAFITRSDGRSDVEELPCSFCTGTGDVTVEKAHAYRKGRELAGVRILEGRSLHEAAMFLGMTPRGTLCCRARPQTRQL